MYVCYNTYISNYCIKVTMQHTYNSLLEHFNSNVTYTDADKFQAVREYLNKLIRETSEHLNTCEEQVLINKHRRGRWTTYDIGDFEETRRLNTLIDQQQFQRKLLALLYSFKADTALFASFMHKALVLHTTYKHRWHKTHDTDRITLMSDMPHTFLTGSYLMY